MAKKSNFQDRKKESLHEIKQIVQRFCEQYLSEEIQGYAFKLCETLGRKRKVDISKGKKEVWAAAIVYVIARLNFLFDKENEFHITHDLVNDFFQTKKSTIGNKATQIEKLCHLAIGEEGYCSPEITDAFTFYQTPEGFILSKSMVDRGLIDVEPVEGEEAEEQSPESLLTIEQKRKKELQEQAEMKRKIVEKREEKKKNDDQLGLF
ncbi:MAG: DUF6398 domain-containing protein [bacterium]